MKKIISFAAVLFMAAVLLASCGEKIQRAEFIRGTVSNNVYKSTLSNIKFSPGPAWEFSEDSDIAKRNGIDASEVMDEEDFSKKLNGLTTIIDVTAEDPYSHTSVIILYENMSVSSAASKMTAEEYVEELKKEVGERYATYSPSVSDYDDVTIAGREFKSVKIDLTIGDSKRVQYYFVSKIDDFIMSVSAMTLPDYDVKAELIPLFSTVE